MAERLKLTKAQRDLLTELPTHVVPEYRPGRVLIEKGLAAWADEKTTMMVITEAGRQALRSSDGGKDA
jgi:hypothetical protein